VTPRRYTVHRRDGTTDEVEAEGMWPEGAHLVFRYRDVVIVTPRELVALRVPIAEVERVVRDDGPVSHQSGHGACSASTSAQRKTLWQGWCPESGMVAGIPDRRARVLVADGMS
jgi:hypothetical protein